MFYSLIRHLWLKAHMYTSPIGVWAIANTVHNVITVLRFSSLSFFVEWWMGGGSIHKKAPFDACMHAVFHMKWDWFGYSSLLKVASNSSNRNKRKNTINVNISIVNNPLSVHIHTLGITHPPCGLPFHVNLLLYFSVRLFIYSVQIELENGICGGCRCCSQVSELNDVVT